VKAISLTQPWATLVALEEKRIETRGWSTAYRGPLAIHAAKSFPEDCRDLCDTPPFREVLRAHGLGASDLPRGAVLCITWMDDCVPTERILSEIQMAKAGNLPCRWTRSRHELAFGNYEPRRYGFLLCQVERTFDKPIPARGALGLWDWSEPEGVMLEPLSLEVERRTCSCGCSELVADLARGIVLSYELRPRKCWIVAMHLGSQVAMEPVVVRHSLS
jgi:hypothetical protein